MLLTSTSIKQPLVLTTYLARVMSKSQILARQFLPTLEEEYTTVGALLDPIGDIAHASTIRGIIHRYPDRVLLTPNFSCAAYCRFCFRREQIGQLVQSMTLNDINSVLAYIRSHNTIWEVILSGGDPLLLEHAKLQILLIGLANIQHLSVIRLHTRLPISNPCKISKQLILLLRKIRTRYTEKAFYIVLHCNHASELRSKTFAACQAITCSGIPILAQTVLLKGINDTPGALATLLRALVTQHIKPYYLHHSDLTRGTSHFRTSMFNGQALIRTLRGGLSGVCHPVYVLDIPGGYGKVPVGPNYVQDYENIEIEDCVGRWHYYSTF